MAAKKPGAQATVRLKRLAAKVAKSHELSEKQSEAMLGDLADLVDKHIVRMHERAVRKALNQAVLGTTPDGVKILRPVVKPEHFTSKQIRRAISKAKKVG